MFQFPVYQTKDFYTMVSRFDSGVAIRTIMTYITPEEEQALDDKKTITIDRGSRRFEISPKDVYCYGHIDFRSGSDDYKQLAKMKFLNHLSFCGIWIEANYDYKKHCCYSPIRRKQWYDTTRPEVLAQYTHGVLGKPKLCIIFNHRHSLYGNRKPIKEVYE